MTVQMCPIEIPDGWEFVRYGVPSGDDVFLNEDGEPDSCPAGCVAPWVIIRPARPSLQVDDWVRVSHPGSRVDGKRGIVRRCPNSEVGGYLVFIEGVGALHYQRDNLTKQTRTVDPYTLDQCIEAAVRLGREVRRGTKSLEITTFYSDGVAFKGMSHPPDTYVVAAMKLTWATGEVFGTERWEDAE